MAATTIPTSKQSINALLTTTADNYHKAGVVQDAIFNSNPVFHCLHGKTDGIREEVTGGDMYKVGLMYEGNSTVGSYEGYEQLNIAPQDGITSAYYKKCQYSGAVSLDGLTRLKNRGKAQIQSLLREKVKQTTGQFGEQLDQDLLDIANISTTAATTGNGGKNIIPIPLLVQKVPTDAQDVGSIDQSVETWWANHTAQSTTDAVTTHVQLIGEMRNMYALCSLGTGGAPDILITDMWTYLNYMRGLDEKVRYTQTTKGDVDCWTQHSTPRCLLDLFQDQDPVGLRPEAKDRKHDKLLELAYGFSCHGFRP